MELRDIDLGGTDAESDDRLDDDFFETNDVAVIIDGREFLLVGRKGAGKSALFKKVPQLVEDARWKEFDIAVVNLSPDNYEWSRLTELSLPDMPPEALLKLSWQISLQLQLAEHLLHGKWTLWSIRSSDESKLRRLVVRAFGAPKVGESPLKRAVRFLDSFSEANVSAAEVSMSFKRKVTSRPAVRLTEFEKRLAELVRNAIPKNARIIVQLDRLDDVWDGSEKTKVWLVGLLKAAKSINDSYRGAPAWPTVKAIVYLRTDIYETLRFDEKDKLRSFEKQISWDEASLSALMNKRLPDDLPVERVFESSPISRNQYPLEFFFDHTFLRPREVIQFLRECLQTSPAGSEVIAVSTLKSAINVFSSWKVEDLKLEFAKANPELPELIEALRQGTHRYDSISSIQARLEARAPGAVASLGVGACLQLLFNASVVGVRLNESGKVRFRVNEPNLQLPAVASVYVHPGLRKALLITEARKPRSRGTD